MSLSGAGSAAAPRAIRAEATRDDTTPVSGPVPSEGTGGRRDVTPDVARGVALLGIAVVNAQLLAPHPLLDAADHVSAAFVTLFLENRVWPMFALLFGWGVAAIAARLDTAGGTRRDRDRVLIRRNLWLAGLGLVQVALVFWGDILAVYGLTGLVLVVLLRRSAAVRTVFGCLSLVTWGLGTAVASLAGGSDEVPHSAAFVASIGERLGVFAFWTAGNTLLLTHLAPMLAGVALYRIGALHRPAEHLPLLRRSAVVGGALGVIGAVPLTLNNEGAWSAGSELRAAALGLHAVTGVAAGVASVSVIALWSARRSPDARIRFPLAVLVAVGRRPVTSYLVHSILLGLALSAWAFDLGPTLSAAGTYALGGAVWLCCAGLAWGLAAAGLPGPADTLLRRLSRPAPDR